MRGGASQVLSLQKAGVEKVVSMLKARGHKKLSFSHTERGALKLMCSSGG